MSGWIKNACTATGVSMSLPRIYILAMVKRWIRLTLGDGFPTWFDQGTYVEYDGIAETVGKFHLEGDLSGWSLLLKNWMKGRLRGKFKSHIYLILYLYTTVNTRWFPVWISL